jgi:hypothetical protein
VIIEAGTEAATAGGNGSACIADQVYDSNARPQMHYVTDAWALPSARDYSCRRPDEDSDARGKFSIKRYKYDIQTVLSIKG